MNKLNNLEGLDAIDRALLLVLAHRHQVKTYDLLALGLSPKLGERQLETRLKQFIQKGWIETYFDQPTPFNGHKVCHITLQGTAISEEIEGEELRNGYQTLIRLLAERFIYQLPPDIKKPSIEQVEVLLKQQTPLNVLPS